MCFRKWQSSDLREARQDRQEETGFKLQKTYRNSWCCLISNRLDSMLGLSPEGVASLRILNLVGQLGFTSICGAGIAVRAIRYY